MTDPPPQGPSEPPRLGMATPRHQPDVVPGSENAPGQSTLEQLHRSRMLYPGRMSREQRILRDQVAAERRCAKVLDPLVRVGIRTLHDRRLPHSAGQLDHVVIAGSGIYLVNTVAVTSRRPLQWIGGKVCIDGQTLTGLADFTVSAAEDVAHTVSRDFDPGWTIAVFPLIAIVGERFGMHADDGVEIVGVGHLPARITYRPPTLDPTEMALLADAAARACPPAA